MHTVLHSLSIIVVVQCFTVMNKLSAFKVRRPEQNTALNAKTEQFVTEKISGNTLKQGSRIYSVPWASAEIFPGGQRQHFAYPFQVADDAMQMDVHKTFYPFYTTRKMRHVMTRVTKLHFLAAITRCITIIL